jgi:DNA-directed RNA polymerase specialized sigma24 family protein
LAAWSEGEVGFRAFVAHAEPRLRRGLMASYGPDRGREATAEALAVAWEHWDKVRHMANPVGYLFRVGQSRTRSRKQRLEFARPADTEVWVEPGLPLALSRLSPRQRVVVYLVHGYGFTVHDVAQILQPRDTSVRTHLRRGLSSLRRSLNVDQAGGSFPPRRIRRGDVTNGA